MVNRNTDSNFITNIGTIYPYSKPNLFNNTISVTENLTDKENLSSQSSSDRTSDSSINSSSNTESELDIDFEN